MPRELRARAQVSPPPVAPARAGPRSIKEGAVTGITSRQQASRLFLPARCPASTRRTAALDCAANKGLSPPTCRTMIGDEEALVPLREGRTMAEFAKRRIGPTALEGPSPSPRSPTPV